MGVLLQVADSAANALNTVQNTAESFNLFSLLNKGRMADVSAIHSFCRYYFCFF
jgi:hypothetical protein